MENKKVELWDQASAVSLKGRQIRCIDPSTFDYGIVKGDILIITEDDKASSCFDVRLSNGLLYPFSRTRLDSKNGVTMWELVPLPTSKRYLRAEKDTPQGVQCPKGTYLEIQDNGMVKIVPNSPGVLESHIKNLWLYSSGDPAWAEMPEGFTPPNYSLIPQIGKYYLAIYGSIGDYVMQLSKITSSEGKPYYNGRYIHTKDSDKTIHSEGSFNTLVREATEVEIESWFGKESSKEALLAKATGEYPIGTKYHPIGYDEAYEKSVVKATHLPKWLGNRIEVGLGYIYADERWAQIIKEGKQDFNNNLNKTEDGRHNNTV